MYLNIGDCSIKIRQIKKYRICFDVFKRAKSIYEERDASEPLDRFIGGTIYIKVSQCSSVRVARRKISLGGLDWRFLTYGNDN
jgi:hypothetical protein